MSAHPPFALLADLADAALPAGAAPDARAHVDACASCGETLEGLRASLSLLAAGAAAEPPRAAIRRALRIPLAARAAAAVEGVRLLVARLVFDSLGAEPAPALALRGGAARHMLFEAGPFEIEVSRVEDTLRGSLLPRAGDGARAPRGGTAALYRGKRRVAGAFLDARGRFALDGIPAGSYELRLEAQGTVVRVPDLDL